MYDEEIVLTALREQLQDYFGEQYRYELAESAEEAMEVMEELAQEGVEVVSRFLFFGEKQKPRNDYF